MSLDIQTVVGYAWRFSRVVWVTGRRYAPLHFGTDAGLSGTGARHFGVFPPCRQKSGRRQSAGQQSTGDKYKSQNTIRAQQELRHCDDVPRTAHADSIALSLAVLVVGGSTARSGQAGQKSIFSYLLGLPAIAMASAQEVAAATTKNSGGTQNSMQILSISISIAPVQIETAISTWNA